MTDLRSRDEVDASSRARRGAHRAAPSRLAALLPVVVVVAVVGLAVLALVLFTGLGGGGTGDDVATAPATTATTSPPTTTAPPTTPPTTTPPTTTPPPVDPSDGAEGTDGADGADGQGDALAGEEGADDGAAPPPGGDGARGAPVVVLNSTRTSGLASKTAEELEGEGWTVSSTGDAGGDALSTTRVRYSDPGLESAAQAVAASLGGATVELDDGVDAGVVTVVTGTDRARG